MRTVINIKKLEVNLARIPALDEHQSTAIPTEQIEWSPTLLDGKRVSPKEAEAAVAALGEGWRLPTVKELFALVDHSRHEPAIDTNKFPDTQLEPYWTGTPCAWNASARWVVGFDFGDVDYYSAGYPACVRACRVSQ